MSYLLEPSTLLALNRVALRPGEPHGLRNGGDHLLKSALGAPMASWAGTPMFADAEARAGSLLHSLAINHPFLEGNKRTTTLAVNGYLESLRITWTAKQMTVAKFVIRVVKHEVDVHDTIHWIRENSYRA